MNTITLFPKCQENAAVKHEKSTLNISKSVVYGNKSLNVNIEWNVSKLYSLI